MRHCSRENNIRYCMAFTKMINEQQTIRGGNYYDRYIYTLFENAAKKHRQEMFIILSENRILAHNGLFETIKRLLLKRRN